MMAALGQILRAAIAIGLFMLVLYLLVLRHTYYTAAEDKSDAGEGWPPEQMVVAVVWPQHFDNSLLDGVQIALDELNASQSPLANRITLRTYQETLFDRGDIARRVAAQEDVIAVIGHELAESAIPSSITYEDHGILFLSPTVSLRRLTTHGFKYTFRLVPEEKQFTNALAQFAADQGWKRIGMLYGRIEHGETASRFFQSQAGELGLNIAYAKSFIENRVWQTQDFRQLLADVQNTPVDALMLADQLPWGALVLRDMRVLGMQVPVLATDTMDSLDVWRILEALHVREAANNLYVASVIDPKVTEGPFVSFRERFRQRFNAPPGYRASQGYEAFTLLRNVAEKSSSANPLVLSTSLRTNLWTGLFGEFKFSSDGGILGRDLFIKRMQNGDFVNVDRIEVSP